jgi:hypothetical protein
VGVYLHGRSRWDALILYAATSTLLMVCKRRSSPKTKRQLAELFLATSGDPYPIECSVLSNRDLTPSRHPASYDFHFSESWRKRFATGRVKSNTNNRDPDLAGHVSATRARGARLTGSPITDVFSEVPVEDYIDSVMADYRWARRRANRPGLEFESQMAVRIYFVLNGLRVWSLLATGNVHSKVEGANWALRRLPPGLRTLAASAVACYGRGTEAVFRPGDRLNRFTAFIEARFESELRRIRKL